MKQLNFTLPEFAFLDGDELRGRNVILHVRTASVIEMIEDTGNVFLNDETRCIEFVYHDKYGVPEEMICALHHAPLLDDIDEIEDMMNRAIEFYKNACNKLDSNISSEMYN